MRNFSSFVNACANIIGEQKSLVVITLVGRQGHVPQEIGARAIVTAEGLVWGTIGGGRLEASAIAHSQKMLEERVQLAERQTINLRAELEMVCGGVCDLLFEPWHFEARWTVVVFGAGHVAQAVVPLVATFDCEVIQLDTRAELLARTPERPNLRQVCTPDLAMAVETLPAHAYYVLMTQGHATDLPIAKAILKRGLPK